MKKQIRLSVLLGLVAFCSASYAQNPPIIPGSAESVGLTRIVPDSIVWFSMSKNYPQLNGYTDPNDQNANGSSLEASSGLLGDSTFLLNAATSATNDSSMMSFTTVLIPTDGRPARLDNAFYDDSGKAYLKGINLSRQTGNPGRIGGDPRYGAVNYGTAAEVSLFAWPEFNSDGRWSNPFFQDALGRNCRSYEGQLHRLNPLTLASTPLMKAVDTMFGRLHTNDVAAFGGQDFGRCGSSPIGLDNGNFVFVGEDRTQLNNLNSRAAVATIFGPDGSIVKEAFVVNPEPASPPYPDGSMWNSVGAVRGGFFVRPTGIVYCYDNAGNLQGTFDHNALSGLLYAQGRSDGTRMCSDIRSHYIFIAGKAPESGYTNIMLSAFDANTRTWITNTIVSDGNQDFTDLGGKRYLDRCNVACDAYNRVTVTWRHKADDVFFPGQQCAARVLAFDGTKFTPLTPMFFPFMQHDSDTNNVIGFMNQEPSVAMTPRAIMFYAKGLWNGTGNPTNPPVSQGNSHCFTVVSHPAPIAAPRPQVTIASGSPNSTISWQADAGLFVLQATATPEVAASWADVSPQPASTRTAYVDPTDKYQMSVPTGTGPKFYRLIRRW